MKELNFDDLREARIPDYIFRYYGISKRTDIKRAGTNRRGYQGLRFK